MPSTQVTITKHFPEHGNSNGRAWTRNDFKTDDDVKFQTFDGALASQVLANMHRPVELTYEVQERGQYANNVILSVTPLGGADPAAQATAAAPQQIRPVDRGGGLARAIEFLGVAGESVIEAYDNGSLFDLADAFAEYSAFGTKPGASSSSAPAEAVA